MLESIRRLFRVLLLALRPLSRSVDVWGLTDIIGTVLAIFGLSLPAVGGTVAFGTYEAIAGTGFVLAILMLIAAWKLQQQMDELEARPKPRFVWDAPYPDIRDMYRTPIELGGSGAATGPWSLSECRVASPHFVHVAVRNDPDARIRHREATAQRVIARISFFAEGTERPLFTLDGRWGDTQQPSTRSPFDSIADLLPMDFPPNGERHELDIAMKYEDDEWCYAFANESYRAVDWRKPEWKLVGESFKVRISLQGVGMEDQVRWFALVNLGPGKGMELVAQDAV